MKTIDLLKLFREPYYLFVANGIQLMILDLLTCMMTMSRCMRMARR